MNAAGAILFLWTSSLRNWGRVQLRRLKNPRYVVAAAVGLFYFYTFFLRRFRGGPDSGGPPSPEVMALLEAGLTLFAVVSALMSLIFISRGAGVPRFTEAEIQYLFPAPFTRRTILQIRVLKSLLRTGLSATIATLLFRRAWGANPVAMALGAWLSFSVLSLWGYGAEMVREGLIQHGRAAWRRAWPALLVAALAALAVVTWALQPHRPPPPLLLSEHTVPAWADWTRELLDSRPLSFVLWPMRAAVRVSLAETWGELLRRLPAGLAVVGVLYAWVVTSGVAFEDAAVEASSRWAAVLELARKSRGVTAFPRKVKSTKLPLPARGPTWVAVTWKNLIAIRRGSGPVLGVMVTLMLVTMTIIVRADRARNGDEAVLPLFYAAALVSVIGFLCVMGPVAMAPDLRQDMPMFDVLRTLPLNGPQLLLGEVLAPALVLGASQWVLWVVAVAVTWSQSLPESFDGRRAVLVLSGMVLGPVLSFAGLCVQNAGAIFFPAWTTGEARTARGFEATGQRLLTLVGTVLVLTVGLIPAALVGGLAAFAARFVIGPWGLLVGSVLAAAVLLAESLLVVRGLGGVFERIDLSE
ncbi:MAG TPA: putative ABC exporter domain-containing protein [Myxococcaceae bacterium]|nr:putative ABC exporter domain-containing protein [Myxococcaceae bacterium]